MTVYGTATSLYTLARIISGHAYLSLAYILTYTIIYYIHLYHITIKLSPTYKNGHNFTNIIYNTLHIIKRIYKLLQPGALSGQPLGYCNPHVTFYSGELITAQVSTNVWKNELLVHHEQNPLVCIAPSHGPSQLFVYSAPLAQGYWQQLCQ